MPAPAPDEITDPREQWIWHELWRVFEKNSGSETGDGRTEAAWLEREASFLRVLAAFAGRLRGTPDLPDGYVKGDEGYLERDELVDGSWRWALGRHVRRAAEEHGAEALVVVLDAMRELFRDLDGRELWVREYVRVGSDAAAADRPEGA